MTSEQRADCMALIGFSLMCFGFWLAWPPLGFIVGGGTVFWSLAWQQARKKP